MQNQFTDLLNDDNIATVAANLAAMLKANRHQIARHLTLAAENDQSTVGMRFDLRWTVKGIYSAMLDCKYAPIEERFTRTCVLLDPKQETLGFNQSTASGIASTYNPEAAEASLTSLTSSPSNSKANAPVSTSPTSSDHG